jgi:hypothetical protein
MALQCSACASKPASQQASKPASQQASKPASQQASKPASQQASKQRNLLHLLTAHDHLLIFVLCHSLSPLAFSTRFLHSFAFSIRSLSPLAFSIRFLHFFPLLEILNDLLFWSARTTVLLCLTSMPHADVYVRSGTTGHDVIQLQQHVHKNISVTARTRF